MTINRISKSEFKKCENSTTKKILLNICDYLIYGLTDTNYFYRNWYVNPQKDYNSIEYHRLGDVFYSYPLSYHIIANLICVELPKTNYNLNPFKYNHFKTCCDKITKFIDKNDVKEIHAPIFGTKILEGNWKKILDIMNESFSNSSKLTSLFIYE